MTDTNTLHATTRAASPLLRRIDGVELPAAGAWTVPGRHATIALCVPRSLRKSNVHMGRASEATIVIGDDPDEMFVAMLFDVPGVDITGASAADSPPIVLEAQSVPGPHRWAMSGTLSSIVGVSSLRGTLGYHGVWRRGDHTYGWFALTGTIDRPAGTMRRMRFRVELLASRPDDVSL